MLVSYVWQIGHTKRGNVRVAWDQRKPQGEAGGGILKRQVVPLNTKLIHPPHIASKKKKKKKREGREKNAGITILRFPYSIGLKQPQGRGNGLLLHESGS